ncbi:MAG: hypothetical protein LBL66_09150 [Clostridiales bacterium]|nr:hypothetical protein [Clostridiales bacterium]
MTNGAFLCSVEIAASRFALLAMTNGVFLCSVEIAASRFALLAMTNGAFRATNNAQFTIHNAQLRLGLVTHGMSDRCFCAMFPDRH